MKSDEEEDLRNAQKETYLSSETEIIDSFSMNIASDISSGIPSILFNSSALRLPLNLSFLPAAGFISVDISFNFLSILVSLGEKKTKQFYCRPRQLRGMTLRKLLSSTLTIEIFHVCLLQNFVKLKFIII